MKLRCFMQCSTMEILNRARKRTGLKYVWLSENLVVRIKLLKVQFFSDTLTISWRAAQQMNFQIILKMKPSNLRKFSSLWRIFLTPLFRLQEKWRYCQVKLISWIALLKLCIFFLFNTGHLWRQQSCLGYELEI